MDLQLQVLDALHRYFGEDISLDFHDEKGDGKHFYIDICSEKFRNKSRIEQSKMVYEVLDKFMKTGMIHALRMKCRVPE